MCDIIFENTKGIYAEATVQVSIVLVMKGQLASETINYVQKPCINLSQSATY